MLRGVYLPSMAQSWVFELAKWQPEPQRCSMLTFEKLKLKYVCLFFFFLNEWPKLCWLWITNHLSASLKWAQLELLTISQLDWNITTHSQTGCQSSLCLHVPIKTQQTLFTLMARDHSGPANETFMCSLRGTVAVPVQKLLRKIKEVSHFLCWLCPQFSCSTTSVMLSPWKHPGGSADSDACVRVMTFNQLHTLTFPVSSPQCCWETQQEIDFRNTPIAL